MDWNSFLAVSRKSSSEESEKFCIRNNSLDGFRAILSRLLVLSLFLDPEDLSLSGPELPESLIGLFLDFLPGSVPPIGLLENNKTIIINNVQSTAPTYLHRETDFSFFFLGKVP